MNKEAYEILYVFQAKKLITFEFEVISIKIWKYFQFQSYYSLYIHAILSNYSSFRQSFQIPPPLNFYHSLDQFFVSIERYLKDKDYCQKYGCIW